MKYADLLNSTYISKPILPWGGIGVKYQIILELLAFFHILPPTHNPSHVGGDSETWISLCRSVYFLQIIANNNYIPWRWDLETWFFLCRSAQFIQSLPKILLVLDPHTQYYPNRGWSSETWIFCVGISHFTQFIAKNGTWPPLQTYTLRG